MELAKMVAKRAHAPEIRLEHVRKAVSMLELEDGVDSAMVLMTLGMPRPSHPAPPLVLVRLLAEAARTPPMPISEEVSTMLQSFDADYVFYKNPVGLIEDRAGSAARPRRTRGTPITPSFRDEASEAVNDLIKQNKDEEWADNPFGKPDVDGGPAFYPAAQDVPSMVEWSRKLRNFLEKFLFGQPDVIDALADGLIYQSLRGQQTGPLATLFMVGPPAVGKTFTTRLLADALDGAWPIKTIDMSSMQSANQAFALTGMSQGYGDALPGELTNFVRQNPRCIVVLDNIDKSHPNIQNVLLPLFDSGFLKDQFGFYPDDDRTKPKLAPNEVDFRNAIVVLTTSAASGSLQNADFQAYLEEHPAQAREAVLDLLSRQHGEFREGPMACFSPDLLSRLSAELVLIYRPLALPALEAIARGTWDAFVDNLRTAFDCQIEVASLPDLLRAATLYFGGTLDARKVAGSPLDNLLFGGVIDRLQELGNDRRIGSVRFELANGFTEAMDRLLAELDAKDPVRELRRKQRTLQFAITSTLTSDGDIVTVVRDPQWVTAVRAGDLGVQGGLQAVIPTCGFDDIAGHEVIKTRLRDTVRILKQPQTLKTWGVDPPRGMLLFGPPGTGKTMLAKALAKDADLPFIASTGPELLDISQMHSVFERARHYAPCILFIDEIDILGSRDSAGYPLAINQLLTELDGFGSHAGGVFTIAASNYPEKIDKAILRAGRIDLHVEVPALDPPARRYFFSRLQKLPGGESLALDELVQFSSGMSGAELQRVHRELALELIRTGQTSLTQVGAVEMINVVKYGTRQSAETSRLILEHTAYHEAGHAVVSMTLCPERKIEQITIIPRARARGFVAFQQDDARKPMTREGVLNEMAIALAGRVSQEVKYGEDGADDGASSDIEKATRLAECAIARWGLDTEVGCRTLPTGGSDPGTVIAPDDRVQFWIQAAHQKAKDVVTQREALIKGLADALMTQESLSGENLELLTKRSANP
jgi:cell division protease FtsH